MSRPRENCGLFGVFGHPEAARLTYYGLFSLQHRGQEAAGIATTDGRNMVSYRALGLVDGVFDSRRLDGLRNPHAIGHLRYSTTGSSTTVNTQPLVVDYVRGKLAVAHNGNLTNSMELRNKYEHSGSIFQSTMDSEIIVHMLAENSVRSDRENYKHCLQEIRGAYSLLFLTPGELVAARDPQGYRPLSIGRIQSGLFDTWVVASETCAFDLVGAEFVREVEPGEMVFIDAKGLQSQMYVEESQIRRQHCIFEHVYFARPDSLIFGDTVHEVRRCFGCKMAQMDNIEADVVFPVPDSGNSAAIGYAQASGLPLDMGFVRNHYVGRTFIEPLQERRDINVRIKLNMVESVVQGKRVVVVDDSIVRGTTCRGRVNALKAAGAREVHMRVSCPPIRYPCHYGIDFPTRTELIAGKHAVEEICGFIGATTLKYLGREEMLSCVSRPPEDYCTACFDGSYFVGIPSGQTKTALER
jgi:amidophosphoribosyltransferase